MWWENEVKREGYGPWTMDDGGGGNEWLGKLPNSRLNP